MNAARLFIGGVAALALLLPSVAPSWAADTEVTVTGVVTLDEVPTAGIEICDLFDQTNCVTSESGGHYTIVPKLSSVVPGGGSPELRCLSVSGTDDYPGLGWSTNFGQTCELTVPAAGSGSQVELDIAVTAYPLAWGQVVNRAGRPIVGAAVASGNGRPASLTDAQGRFHVKMGPYLYDQHYLRITAKGYQDVATRYSLDGDLGKIVMAAAGEGDLYSFSGRVVDANGRPFVGVSVCIADAGCIGSVGNDGSYYGLLPTAAAVPRDFELYLPGAALPVSVVKYFGFAGAGFITNADFTLSSVRRLVSATPKITGSPKIGKRLTVRVGTWLPRPVATSCAWFVGSKVVKRSCSPLRVKASYRGKRITVKVTGVRSGYGRAVAVSRRTSRVHR